MKLSSAHLEAFYAVAKVRHFTKAAEMIHVTQSALSQRILNLESELQTTLFVRSSSGIELTETAYELLRYCQLQESFEEEFLGKLRNQNGSELSGILRIAGFSSVMPSAVLPALKELLVQNPRVRLQSLTREIHELLPMLRHGEADYIITDHQIDSDEIESISIGRERNVLVEKDNYHGADIFLDHDEKDETTRKYLKLAKKSQKKFERHYLDDIYGIIEGVQLGLGRAVLPEHLIANQKGLRVVQKNVVLENEIFVHFIRKPFHSTLHHSVLKALEEKVADILRAKI